MLGIYVTVPITCFRKGLAREYLETEQLPHPVTCYGFLLSLVGETNREMHLGCRVSPTLLNQPAQSVVLRTVWRVKSKPLGSPGNTRPDYQQLLAPVELVIWLDSSEERTQGIRLEARVERAIRAPATIERFGGLSLGESTHLVDEVNLFEGPIAEPWKNQRVRAYLLAAQGRLTLPVWVDHVGSAGTHYVTGNLEESDTNPPPREKMPQILIE